MNPHFFIKLLTLTTVLLCCNAGYNEDLTKNKFIQLASAAYTYWPGQCVSNSLGNATITKSFNGKCGQNWGEWEVCYGFVGVSHKDKAIFMVYRGTISSIQLLYEGYESAFAPMERAKIGGLVSKYFYRVYKVLRDGGLNDEVKKLSKQFQKYQIWITGHSLGGALASISAAELVAVDGINKNKIVLTTFGQPRVGNKEYKDRHDKLLPNAYRVVNQGDIVPHLPPTDFNNHLYYHSSTEIWYKTGFGDPKTSKFIKCKVGEDSECSNSISPYYTIHDHIFYFKRFIVAYGAVGCLF